MPILGHCGTCKHWQFKSPDPADLPGVRRLDAYIHPLGVGRCNVITRPETGSDADELPKIAYVLDVENYAADFLTRASFGCTLYERADIVKTPPAPLKLRRLSLDERIAMYAEKVGQTTENALTTLRFLTNTVADAELDNAIDSPLHTLLDFRNIPRELPDSSDS